MIEDDVAAILTKTREYYNFIKGRLDKELIVLKAEDDEALKAIDSYLARVSKEINQVKSEASRNILGTCITYLQRLDHLAKDYKLFSD